MHGYGVWDRARGVMGNAEIKWWMTRLWKQWVQNGPSVEAGGAWIECRSS